MRRSTAKTILAGWSLAALLLVVPNAEAQCVVDERVTGEILLELEPGIEIATIQQRYDLVFLDSIPSWRYHAVAVNAGPGEDLEVLVDSTVAQMEEDEDIKRAEPHRVLETPEGVQLSIPDLGVNGNAQVFNSQPATATVRTHAAQQNHTGEGVTVAVIDTGMAFHHPETAGSIRGTGADFAGGDGTGAAQGNGLDDDGDGVADESSHHATFVAGLVHLVAPDARILPVRVLEADGKGATFGVAKGILWAVDNGADVINLSESLLHGSRALERAIEDAVDRGVTVVVAAGNRGLPIVDGTILNDCVSFPASHPEVIAVAAVDENLVRAAFSDYGPDVDISAPGTDLISTYDADGWAGWGGTSFASPLVAGAAALILEKYPCLNALEVKALLQQTAQPDNNPVELDGLMGAGVVDTDALTQALSSARCTLRAEPTPSGTVLRWAPVLNASTYDVVRGDLFELHFSGPGMENVELGSLTCVGDELTGTDTSSTPDPDDLLPGEARFYLFRDDASGGSYGQAGAGEPRNAGAGDCAVTP